MFVQVLLRPFGLACLDQRVPQRNEGEGVVAVAIHVHEDRVTPGHGAHAAVGDHRGQGRPTAIGPHDKDHVGVFGDLDGHLDRLHVVTVGQSALSGNHQIVVHQFERCRARRFEA